MHCPKRVNPVNLSQYENSVRLSSTAVGVKFKVRSVGNHGCPIEILQIHHPLCQQQYRPINPPQVVYSILAVSANQQPQYYRRIMALGEDEFLRFVSAMHKADPLDPYARELDHNPPDLGFDLPPVCPACAEESPDSSASPPFAISLTDTENQTSHPEHVCVLRFAPLASADGAGPVGVPAHHIGENRALRDWETVWSLVTSEEAVRHLESSSEASEGGKIRQHKLARVTNQEDVEEARSVEAVVQKGREMTVVHKSTSQTEIGTPQASQYTKKFRAYKRKIHPARHSKYCHICRGVKTAPQQHPVQCHKEFCARAVCARCVLEFRMRGITTIQEDNVCAHCIKVCDVVDWRQPVCEDRRLRRRPKWSKEDN